MQTGFLPSVRTVSSLRAHVRAWRERGQTVALVPTMGALHEGHLSPLRLAKVQADRLVASIFVNPRQFAPDEDFDRYPRDEPKDLERLASAGCDLVYAPAVEEMYPDGFATGVSVQGVSEDLEGASRPGHFDGVATVVAKLLIQAAPDIAVFGEKDYQQLLVIRRLARDLDLTVRIMAAPTGRAGDGLALSSRNAYLDKRERALAPRLHAVLRASAEALAQGASIERVEASGREALERSGFERVDYLAVRDAEDLARLADGPLTTPARVLAAAWLGRTRLIDNVAAEPRG